MGRTVGRDAHPTMRTTLFLHAGAWPAPIVSCLKSFLLFQDAAEDSRYARRIPIVGPDGSSFAEIAKGRFSRGVCS